MSSKLLLDTWLRSLESAGLWPTGPRGLVVWCETSCQSPQANIQPLPPTQASYLEDIEITMSCFIFFSPFSSLSPPAVQHTADCLRRLRRPAPLLLPGGVHLDVPGGCAALHHAGGGVWERALAPPLLLHGGLRRPGTDCSRFSRRGLPQLRHGQNVSTDTEEL